jgi:mannose-6-phosphate isomerase
MKPIKFEFLLKPTIWAGEEITKMKNIADKKGIGESWEISGVPGDETRVVEGDDLGATLPELIEKYGAKFVGEKNLQQYGTTFPLLIKFISAAEPLSIQVHPDDAMANRMGHPYGKTEMWYIVGSGKGASLCSGFAHDFSAEAYTNSLEDGSLEEHLAYHDTKAGDCFFIPAGRIHSIGADNFLIEIQQSSNDTFRVYDFNRTDAQGNRRELHVAQAQEALDYKAYDEYRSHYTAEQNAATLMVECPQFTTRLIKADQELVMNYADIDSFVILIAYEGSAQLTDSEGNTTTLAKGESILLPACNENLTITPVGGEQFSCVETFVV